MISILIVAIVILAALSVALWVAVNNLLTQNDLLKDSLLVYSNKIGEVEEEAIKYQRYYLELITQTYQELQRIDKRGSFSSDDEVGFSFRILFTAIENLKLKLGAVEIEQKDDIEKTK